MFSWGIDIKPLTALACTIWRLKGAHTHGWKLYSIRSNTLYILLKILLDVKGKKGRKKGGGGEEEEEEEERLQDFKVCTFFGRFLSEITAVKRLTSASLTSCLSRVRTELCGVTLWHHQDTFALVNNKTNSRLYLGYTMAVTAFIQKLFWPTLEPTESTTTFKSHDSQHISGKHKSSKHK